MEASIDLDGIYIPSDDIVARQIEDQLIIVPVSLNVIDFEDSIYTFNSTGRDIWSRLERKVQICTIIEELSKDYSASKQTITEDVLGLLKELLKKKIVLKFK